MKIISLDFFLNIKMGMQYASLPNSDESNESGLSRIFGIAFMITQSSTIWGNLIGSVGIAQ